MSLKSAKLLHNPKAGEGEITSDELVSLIEESGFDCSYSSTKEEGWEKLKEGKIDFVVLAGGDGTVRKVAEELLEKKVIDKRFPIGLLPMGTANNIAKTLGIGGNTAEIIDRWHEETIHPFDVGRIENLKESRFFLESIGFGIFPELMKLHTREQNKEASVEESIESALQMLQDVIQTKKTKHCSIIVDDQLFEGDFILVEIMNTSSIGPNLQLAPDADPGDGKLDILMIAENQRDELAEYVTRKLGGKEVHNFKTVKASKVSVAWEGHYLHVDDELIKLDEPKKINIELVPCLLEFLV